MYLNPEFGISPELSVLADRAMALAAPQLAAVGDIAAENQQRVLAAFQRHHVGELHFGATTGYGYDDIGRDTLDCIWAEVFGAEDALVRHFMISGTHALTVMLFGVLRPGEMMLTAAGRPYDTLQGVIGIDGPAPGTLRELGVRYRETDLRPDGTIDYEALAEGLAEHPRMVYVQRSNGYAVRPALTVDEIGKIVRLTRDLSPESVVAVDNCYGEFAETREPGLFGADLCAGSLIKNPGGGMADCGGYIAGRADLVKRCAERLTAPGLGRHAGASLGQNRSMYRGLFYAPHTTGEAMKTAVFAAALFELLGYSVSPRHDAHRSDIVQTVNLGTPEGLEAFCQGIQSGSAIDSYVTPEPWDMPGYDVPVIMAAGAFVQGASIELSADGPMRPPYSAFLQGGLIFESAKIGVIRAAQRLMEKGLLPEGKTW